LLVPGVSVKAGSLTDVGTQVLLAPAL